LDSSTKRNGRDSGRRFPKTGIFRLGPNQNENCLMAATR
jgi:hypothetical protein